MSKKLVLSELNELQKLEYLCLQLQKIKIKDLLIWNEQKEPCVSKFIRRIFSQCDVPNSLLTIKEHDSKKYCIVDLNPKFKEDLRMKLDQQLQHQFKNPNVVSMEKLDVWLVQLKMPLTVTHVQKIWQHVFEGRVNYRGNGPQNCDRLWVVGLLGCATVWNYTQRTNDRNDQLHQQHLQMRQESTVPDESMDMCQIKRPYQPNQQQQQQHLQNKQDNKQDIDLELLHGCWKRSSDAFIVAEIKGWNPVQKTIQHIEWNPQYQITSLQRNECQSASCPPKGCSFVFGYS
jgi:hypothetical protein